MEDSSKYSMRPKIEGDKSEVFRVYYDRNTTSFNEFLLMENFSLIPAAKMGWRIFKAYPSFFIDPYLICKN